MPVYVYHCDNCGRGFEFFQHYTDDPLTTCPECQTAALRKVFQPAHAHFKGKGWYVKDRYDPDAYHG